MPIYEYLCENGHRFDALQKFSDDPLKECEVCEAPVQRVLHPVAVHFKGSGFYSTDYGRGDKRRDGDGSGDSKGAPSTEKAASSGSSSSEGGGSSKTSGDSKPSSSSSSD